MLEKFLTFSDVSMLTSQHYIHDELFQPRDWAAPGRQCRIICNAENCAAIHALHDATETSKVNQIKCSEGHRWVQKKTVADVVEAFIGAHLVDGGPGAALAFMHWLGIEVDFDPDLVSQASARCAGDVRVIQAVDLSKLEGVLGYTFQNKAVMVEALTHSSYDRPLDKCYQVQTSFKSFITTTTFLCDFLCGLV